MAFKYRRIVIAKNNSFAGLKAIPKYKNVNYEFNLLKEKEGLLDKVTIFIGSSIIERWDFEKYFNSRTFLNRGVGNNTSSDLLIRFYEDVINLTPEKVVIYISTNDVKFNIDNKRTLSNLEKMINLSKKHSIKPVVLTPVPVLFEKSISLKYQYSSDNLYNLYKKIIRICNMKNVQYIDAYECLKKQFNLSELYQKDGLHLNESGYQLLSGYVLKQLECKPSDRR